MMRLLAVLCALLVAPAWGQKQFVFPDVTTSRDNSNSFPAITTLYCVRLRAWDSITATKMAILPATSVGSSNAGAAIYGDGDTSPSGDQLGEVFGDASTAEVPISSTSVSVTLVEDTIYRVCACIDTAGTRIFHLGSATIDSMLNDNETTFGSGGACGAGADPPALTGALTPVSTFWIPLVLLEEATPTTTTTSTTTSTSTSSTTTTLP